MVFLSVITHQALAVVVAIQTLKPQTVIQLLELIAIFNSPKAQSQKPFRPKLQTFLEQHTGRNGHYNL
jgi:hypothetical protein